jgi:cytochrome b
MRRLIWPLPLRLLHGLLALSVIMAFVTHDVDGPWHDWPGYVALAAASLRLAWGMLPATGRAPARYSRLADFVRGPSAVIHFTRNMLLRQEPRYLGHNPLAGWIVLSLLLVSACAGISGWMLGTDSFFGVAWVMQLHSVSGYAIVPLVLLHWAALAYSSWRHRENLVASMLHGHKDIKAPR